MAKAEVTVSKLVLPKGTLLRKGRKKELLAAAWPACAWRLSMQRPSYLFAGATRPQAPGRKRVYEARGI